MEAGEADSLTFGGELRCGKRESALPTSSPIDRSQLDGWLYWSEASGYRWKRLRGVSHNVRRRGQETTVEADDSVGGLARRLRLLAQLEVAAAEKFKPSGVAWPSPSEDMCL